jgi:predicted MFS family arabinose efflux permease
VTDSFAKQRRLALILLVLAYAMSMADRMVLSVLFEPIKAEFGLQDVQLGLLGGLSFALFYATLGVPIAILADRSNRRNIIAASLALFSLTTALCGAAWNFASLVFFRMLVGVGEAGVNPSSHSILADYYPPEKRASAMSMLSVGAGLGQILGLVAGGLIGQYFGWRVALFTLGVPGLILALLVFLFLKLPARGQSDQADPHRHVPTVDQLPAPSLLEVAGFMWRSLAMRHMLMAGTLAVTMSYGVMQWLPAFFMRTHDLSQAQVGLLMGGLFGLLGVAGALTAGVVFDRLASKKSAYGVWALALSQVFVAPIAIAAYQAESLALAIGLFIIPAFTASFFLGPLISLNQSLVTPSMRSVSSAIKMLVFNLIGLGIGPVLIGSLSDFFEPSHGKGSLAIALSIGACISFWTALHLWRCGVHLDEGLAAARLANGGSS